MTWAVVRTPTLHARKCSTLEDTGSLCELIVKNKKLCMHTSTHHMSLYMYALVLKQIALDPLFGDDNFTVSQTSKGQMSCNVNGISTSRGQVSER